MSDFSHMPPFFIMTKRTTHVFVLIVVISFFPILFPENHYVYLVSSRNIHLVQDHSKIGS